MTSRCTLAVLTKLIDVDDGIEGEGNSDNEHGDFKQEYVYKHPLVIAWATQDFCCAVASADAPKTSTFLSR